MEKQNLISVATHSRQTSQDAGNPRSSRSSRSVNMDESSTDLLHDFDPYFNHGSGTLQLKIKLAFDELKFNNELLDHVSHEFANKATQGEAGRLAKHNEIEMGLAFKKREAAIIREHAEKIENFSEPSLEKLILWNNNAPRNELRFPAAMKLLNEKEISDKACLFLEKFGLTSLPELPQHAKEKIFNLSLKNNQLGWPSLAELNGMSALGQLHLDCNGLEFFSSASSKLKQLTLNGNSLRHIKLDCDNLYQADLSDNPGLASLDQMKCPGLQYLSLVNTNVQQSPASLKAQFPALQWIRDAAGRVHTFH